MSLVPYHVSLCPHGRRFGWECDPGGGMAWRRHRGRTRREDVRAQQAAECQQWGRSETRQRAESQVVGPFIRGGISLYQVLLEIGALPECIGLGELAPTGRADISTWVVTQAGR